MVLTAVAIAAGSTAGRSAAAEPGLVGDWRFDEPGGQSAIDTGPYGLDGQLGTTGAPDVADPTRLPGASGSALRFGGGSFVRLPDAAELAVERLTAEAVVRAPASPGSYRYIVSRGSSGCFAGSYGLYTGVAQGIAMYVYDGSRYVVSATARPADVWNGAWHHVAGTFDGSVVRLYLDGRPVGDPLVVPMRIDYASTTANAAFGRYVGDCDLSFEGDLDAIRLWSRPLSQGEAAAAAALALHPGDPTPLPTDPLPAAAPATILRAPDPPDTHVQGAPGAPHRACAVRLSRTRIPAKRRTRVGVRVTLRGQPVPAVRVVARRRGRHAVIAAARTGPNGRVPLVMRVRKPGRVQVKVAMRPSCALRHIRVAQRK